MDTKQRVRNYFSKAISTSIRDDDDIFNLSLVDSLFALQLVMFVEQEFDLRVDGKDIDLDNFCTINAITAFVEGKRDRVAR